MSRVFPTALLCVLAAIAVASAESWSSFFHISDVHTDPFYNATREALTRCRDQKQVITSVIEHISNSSIADDPLWAGVELPTAPEELLAFYDRVFPHRQEMVEGRLPGHEVASSAAHPWGRYGCDPPLQLTNSMFSAMQRVNATPSFIVLTGDSAAHDLWTPYIRIEGVRQTAEALNNAFPNTPIAIAIGNNDCFPDYHLSLPPAGDTTHWLEQLYDAWEPFIPVEQKDTFLEGGYYALDVPGEPIVVLSLNTIWYPAGHTPEIDPSSNPDPAGQFAWIEQNLKAARSAGKTVYLIGHVPPRAEDWQDAFLATMQSLMTEYVDAIGGSLYGHHHTDQILLVKNSTDETTPLYTTLLSPSMTPGSGGNPTFRVGKFDSQSGVMMDYVQYYAPLVNATLPSNEPIWQEEYTFSRAYNVSSFDAVEISNLIQRMIKEPGLYEAYSARKLALSNTAKVSDLCMMLEGNSAVSFLKCDEEFSKYL